MYRESQKVHSASFVIDISAVHAHFRMKFYATVKHYRQVSLKHWHIYNDNRETTKQTKLVHFDAHFCVYRLSLYHSRKVLCGWQEKEPMCNYENMTFIVKGIREPFVELEQTFFAFSYVICRLESGSCNNAQYC